MSQFNKTVLQAVLIAAYAAWFILPGWAFFHARGGIGFTEGLDLHSSLQLLFPLVGLYAFTLVTGQVFVATNLWWLKKLWPNVIQFHRYQGGTALLFAMMHPLTIFIGYGAAIYLNRSFVSPELRLWLVPAYLGLTLLLTTVITASMAWYSDRYPWWRKLHRLNYLVFALFWIHSWNIGSDTHLYPLKIVWTIVPIILLVSAILKYRVRLQKLPPPTTA